MGEKDYVVLNKLVISDDSVRGMTKSQKRQYLMITNMLRDLNLLQKLLLFTNNNESIDEPTESAKTTISFFFLKTLISKTHEMWEFMGKEGLCEEEFDGTLKVLRKEVVDFFSVQRNRDIFSFIRNKFGFHYEADHRYKRELEDLIEPAMNGHEMDMWLSVDDSGNEIFESSNAVMLKVIFQRMRDAGFIGDEKVLMGQLFDSTLKISRIFREFYLMYMVEIILKGIQLEDLGVVQVMAPLLSKTKLPLIVKCDRPGISRNV